MRNTVVWSSSYFTSLPSCALFSTADTGRRFQGDKKGKFRMHSPPLLPPQAGSLAAQSYGGGKDSLHGPSSHLRALPWFHLPSVDLGLDSRNITSSRCPYVPRTERVFFLPSCLGCHTPVSFWLLGYSLRFLTELPVLIVLFLT